MSERPALFDRAGGQPAIRALIDAFYDLVERDDLLSPLFPEGMRGNHRAIITAYWVEAFGGPADYTQRHGGYRAMLEHHRGLAITPEQRFRFVSLMHMAAEEAGLPSDPAFRAAFIGYVESGTKAALQASQPGAELPAGDAPVPRI